MAYPPALEFPAELDIVQSRVVQTGPFLEIQDIPSRAEARLQLGFTTDEKVVVYAPRGMTFGRAFGEQVLAALVGSVIAIHAKQRVRLVLISVADRNDLRCPGVPDALPDNVEVIGPLPPPIMLTYIRAADVAVTEGSNMTLEAAALGTPIVMIPGPIYETWLLGTYLARLKAATVIWIERVTPESLARAIGTVFSKKATRVALVSNAKSMIGDQDGVTAAAQLVMEMASTA